MDDRIQRRPPQRKPAPTPEEPQSLASKSDEELIRRLNKKPSNPWGGRIAAGFLGLIGLGLITGKMERIFLISGADWYIHEVGHLLFGFFGRFLSIAGGTLLQLAVPTVAMVSFYLTGQRVSTGVGAFWLGENLLNVARYMADARAGRIPLFNFAGEVGREGHDWYNMLSAIGLLKADRFLGGCVYGLGSAFILASIALCLVPFERWGELWTEWKPKIDAFLFEQDR